MKPANVANISARVTTEHEQHAATPLHPAWGAFIRYCAELQHGEIEILRIQDGLPVLAEVVRRKVKFTS
jgi:hypothetical protein